MKWEAQNRRKGAIFISNRVVLDPAMKCVAYKQTNKTDHIYFAQFFFVAENIGLFFSLSIFKNIFNQFFMYSSNETAGLFNKRLPSY